LKDGKGKCESRREFGEGLFCSSCERGEMGYEIEQEVCGIIEKRGKRII
jgi:hypothetical protein